MKTYIDALLTANVDFIELDKSKRVERVRSSSRTKFVTYRMINPTLEVHPIYRPGCGSVDDYLRITLTRFRTSSHRLRIETGRWSRIDRESRLCQCGEGVQTEEHALMCNIVADIRTKYGHDFTDFSSFMTEKKTKSELLMLYEILNRLEG